MRLLAICALAAAPALQAQDLFDAAPGQQLRFHATDNAVLSDDANRNDIACRVEPLRPRLNFDLKYTAGYIVHLPAEAVSQAGDQLRVLFRVRALLPEPGELVYFRQSFNLLPGSSEGGGTAAFLGRYFLGPGRYRVDWLMRNQQGRVCSSHWTVQAPRPSHEGRLAASAPPNLIAPFRTDTFDEEPPVARDADSGSGLHVRLLLNLAPLDRNRYKLGEFEIASIVGMLRSLHREPSLGTFSLVAFNAYDRQIVYEAERGTRVDFPALGRAIESMDVGTVEAAELADSEGEQRFLAELLDEALAPGDDPPDAIVALGAKVDREGRIPDGMLTAPRSCCQIFRFSFDRNPGSYPWMGALEMALQPFGVTTYTVTRPQDYTRAVAGLLDAMEGTPRSRTSRQEPPEITGNAP